MDLWLFEAKWFLQQVGFKHSIFLVKTLNFNISTETQSNKLMWDYIQFSFLRTTHLPRSLSVPSYFTLQKLWYSISGKKSKHQSPYQPPSSRVTCASLVRNVSRFRRKAAPSSKVDSILHSLIPLKVCIDCKWVLFNGRITRSTCVSLQNTIPRFACFRVWDFWGLGLACRVLSSFPIMSWESLRAKLPKKKCHQLV